MEIWETVINSLYRVSWVDIGIAIAIFLVFHVFRKLFTRYLFRLIIRLTKKTPTDLLTNLFLAFEKPLRVFFVIIGIYLALLYLPFNVPASRYVTNVYEALLILLVGWGLYNFFSTNSAIFSSFFTQSVDVEEESMLIPFLSKVLRFLIIILTFGIFLGALGYEVSGLVAGLGLGGLAFALAAQDTVSNFFGGVIIITERPFKKGDWIETPTVQGVVEDINFRSTKIRTFADSVVTVPNSTLANEPITNWSEMGRRRITFNLGVTYTTPRRKLEVVVRRIEELLLQHPEVHQQTIMVRFSEFNNSSLDIFIYFFTNTTIWPEWLKVKEDINFKIMDILEEEGVAVAFPSRSVYFENRLQKTEINDIENGIEHEQ
ncbi:mechanosensitive ion channel family protein [Bacillus alkalicellulosilyticus]|uniref:mechanosensitive ion channel family protein n=1 Tax=Alkalihalobacterium alkalicellulosilyticum TaxID=1912214 RepID=UPI001FECD9D3|nr:mechanosensitive ion channel family protein [Bacillus alkalicellulosilyticus]